MSGRREQGSHRLPAAGQAGLHRKSGAARWLSAELVRDERADVRRRAYMRGTAKVCDASSLRACLAAACATSQAIPYVSVTMVTHDPRVTRSTLPSRMHTIVDRSFMFFSVRGAARRKSASTWHLDESVSRTQAEACGAVLKNGAGLPESACRSRLQTARCGCIQKAWW